MPLLDQSVSGAPGQRPEAALEPGGHVGLCAEERGSSPSGLSAELKTHPKNPNVTTRGDEACSFSARTRRHKGPTACSHPHGGGGSRGSAWTEGRDRSNDTSHVNKPEELGPSRGLGGPVHEG